jgi:predicted DsbA family dithiol-disulfide isomerase
LALRYYFDLVCPYSYILGFEVERAEDDGLAEIEWLPFELRPAPKELPEPRGTYIRDHWRDHVYGLAATHAVEIHVPRYQPRSTLPWRCTRSPRKRGGVGRTVTPRTGRSL